MYVYKQSQNKVSAELEYYAKFIDIVSFMLYVGWNYTVIIIG